MPDLVVSNGDRLVEPMGGEVSVADWRWQNCYFGIRDNNFYKRAAFFYLHTARAVVARSAFLGRIQASVLWSGAYIARTSG